jgi:hypothetical protein
MLSRKTLSLLLLGALTWLLLVSSPANAAPTGVVDIAGVPSAPKPKPEKPELPKSKADLKKGYFTKAPKKDSSCFFTGMDVQGIGKDAKENTGIAKKKCRDAKLTTLEDIWKNKNLLNRGEWKNPSAKQFEEFVVWVSEVFAEESTGTAYLLIADNTEPRKGSIFYGNEFKEMKAKNKVDKIMRLKFEKNGVPVPAKADKVWWKKGDKDPKTWENIACEFKEFCH